MLSVLLSEVWLFSCFKYYFTVPFAAGSARFYG